MSLPVLVGAGLVGGLGAVLRLLAELRLGPRFGTLAVNLSGAFALGAVTGGGLHGDALRIVGVGFLGAYTTFSAWMLQSRQQSPRAAALDLVGSLALGLLAVWLGRALF